MTDREKLTNIVCCAIQTECVGHCNRKPCTTVEIVVDDLLANGVTVQQWFSVENRLPDVDQEVLVYAGYGLYDVAQYSGGRTFFTLERNPDCWEIVSGVTHWMPLPEPPKEGDNA